MKAVKILGWVFVLLVAIVAGLIVYMFNNINQLVKTAVETVGPEVTHTHVGLRDVDIKLTKGRGELNHFVIGNPEGFSQDSLLTWDSIALEIDPSSISADVVVIKDVVIKGVTIQAEQKGLSTNIQKLLENLDSGESSNSSSQDDKSATSETDVKLALEHMLFAGNSLTVVTEKWGDYTLEMPSFELYDIGDKNTGLTPEQLGHAILKPVLKHIKDHVEARLKSISKEKLKEKLKEKQAELEAKVDEKKAELESKVDEEKADLEAKLAEKKEDLAKTLDENKDGLEEKKEELKEKEDELKEKLDDEVKDKLKNLFD